MPVAGEGIRLGQFLKLADLIDSGSEAKAVVAEGFVLVNGEIETRRGRQLVAGDLVELTGVGPQRRAARVG
ncbi:RNA-binding S4 domain-containing protein [Auraticoccus sp. F435]|uniref:RNA-binding S4 domain-containing protein n=1 Tax=Auraticoccus cholistanensis TaxID=2656650 RepID=A0A6A9V294_9ACTN|nr:RNA-binding S4 domain-containing protein [Auraticoccus cholistanensis]